MRLDVGPAEPASVVAWIDWADEFFGDLRSEPGSKGSPSSDVSGDVSTYLQEWLPGARTIGETYRRQAEVDPDEIEYVLHAFSTLDAQLLAGVQCGARSRAPDESRAFYLVLVRDLLHALEMESPGRAAFVDQLRACWPSAVDAS